MCVYVLYVVCSMYVVCVVCVCTVRVFVESTYVQGKRKALSAIHFGVQVVEVNSR